VLIDLSRGESNAVGWIKRYENSTRFVISVVTEIELMFGARDKANLKTIKSFLSNFEVVQVNETISVAAVQLVEKYCLSHRLQLPDGLIAAMALVNDFDLVTINKKDFRFIDGLKLVDYP
jgi:predicted nucleic acid-binding protein